MNKAIKKAGRMINLAERLGYMILSNTLRNQIVIDLYKNDERAFSIIIDKDVILILKVETKDRDRHVYVAHFMNMKEKEIAKVLGE